MRRLPIFRLAIAVVLVLLATTECFAAPWRLSADLGTYDLPEDEFRGLPDGLFVEHLAGGISVETHWHFAWRLALDVSRYDMEPQPVTTYSDPYGASGITFTPRMYSYVWSVQVGVRGSGRIWSPFLLAGPAYVVQRYKWTGQQPVINYEAIGVAGSAGIDVHPIAIERRLAVGLGVRFHQIPFIDEEIPFGQVVVLNAARMGVGWLVRLGFEL